jgi:hypothetical protein
VIALWGRGLPPAQVAAGSEEAKKPLHGPNQWISELLVPGYRRRTEAYFDAVKGLAERCGRRWALAAGHDRTTRPQRAAPAPGIAPSPPTPPPPLRRLVRLVARSLGLPADHFDPFFVPPVAVLRPLRYAPVKSDPGAGLLGCGAHTDYGMVRWRLMQLAVRCRGLALFDVLCVFGCPHRPHPGAYEGVGLVGAVLGCH